MGSGSMVNSFAAADQLPVKLLRDWRLIEAAVNRGRLIPRHVQLIPTNKCNLKCSFCSCKKEDRNLSLDIDMIKSMVSSLSSLGMESVTITGGGEPLLHPDIVEIIRVFSDAGIDIGLVSNGTHYTEEILSVLHRVKWIRVSWSDDRIFVAERMKRPYEQRLFFGTDWAFSYVVTQNFDLSNLVRLIRFANTNYFTHVRVVADILNANKINMEEVRKLVGQKVDCRKIIFQGRDKPTKGGPCYICYIKPIIHADGKVYACCGAQYAIKGEERVMSNRLCLGTVDEFIKIIRNRVQPFNGNVCDVCYYSDYNRCLEKYLITDLKHRKFL